MDPPLSSCWLRLRREAVVPPWEPLVTPITPDVKEGTLLRRCRLLIDMCSDIARLACVPKNKKTLYNFSKEGNKNFMGFL